MRVMICEDTRDRMWPSPDAALGLIDLHEGHFDALARERRFSLAVMHPHNFARADASGAMTEGSLVHVSSAPFECFYAMPDRKLMPILAVQSEGLVEYLRQPLAGSNPVGGRFRDQLLKQQDWVVLLRDAVQSYAGRVMDRQHREAMQQARVLLTETEKLTGRHT